MSLRVVGKALLPALLLLAFGLLHLTGPGHAHAPEQAQGECQYCHASAQPYLIAAAPPAPSLLLVLQFLLPEQSDQIRLRPCSPYGARAPPSA